MPQPRFTMVVLLVEDVARSVAFYRRLGFHDLEVEDAGARFVGRDTSPLR